MVMMIRDMEMREEGKILGTVETMRDDGKDDMEIIRRLMKKYNLKQKEAEEYVLASPSSGKAATPFSKHGYIG